MKEEAKVEAGVGGCGSKIEVGGRGVMGSGAEAKVKAEVVPRGYYEGGGWGSGFEGQGLMAAGVWRLGYCQGWQRLCRLGFFFFQKKKRKKSIEPCLDARIKGILIDLLFTTSKRRSFM